MTAVQLTAQQRLRHLITLDQLPVDIIQRLFARADALREGWRAGQRSWDTLHGHTVVNLFFEPSTRTRTSFDLAAQRMGADVINFDIANSSTVKGEILIDTLHTLEAMNCDGFVVRHKENGTAEFLARHVRTHAVVINAGDGNNAHPTQGLLDAYTLRSHRPDFANLCVTICGDVLHSRVARSDIHVLRALGIGELRICAPANLLPPTHELPGCRLMDDFDDAVTGADAVIMLRLQKERMTAAHVPSEQAYFARYGLDARRLRLAHPECLVMHPGPINREVEIASAVADGAQSRILQQVSNGVFIRMAVLAELLSGT
ncbi:aspartate carbamoyltransferase catalytic subunit [Tahibacter amnicola]|uniref:Aspartate carbamoyltransferase n=1 Tax=Tahibacter amnicola TaxID=2976241 RepID=A0ABY6BLU2_9GAMM|nr:aspartate carbamoyltransferase catalytic subunit [Tahibacter amnicola]UXI69355.1 aspartate carbamoyltransferase catalytic subunit [Tahibacter amnicola]